MLENTITLLEEWNGISFFSSPELPRIDTVEKDSCGNYHFINGNGKNKIQVIFRINPSGVLVGKRTEEGYKATILGNEKSLVDSVLYDKNLPVGILRSKKENHYLLEAFDDNVDYTDRIFTKNTRTLRKANKLYGKNIDEVISFILAEYITSYDLLSGKQIDFTVWNSSLSGENGLISAVRHANSDKIVYVSLVDAKEFTTESSSAIVLKDGNYVLPIEQKCRIRQLVTNEEIPFDSFVGKADKAMEILDVHAFDKQLFGIYIPSQHFDTATKEVFWSDIEKTRNILLKSITTL